MHDVAFTFLRRDLTLAEDLRDRLGPLDCFVYSRKQDVVAATDGLDSFRTVYRKNSRLNVVLYREGWGSTPWTGVEEIAIKDSCLATKYRSLVLALLDDSAVPPWIPDTHQLFDLKLYSVEDLVGVIKSRAAAQGSILRPESAVEKAKRVASAENTERQARAYLDSVPGADAARIAFAELKSSLVAQAQQVADAHPKWTPTLGQAIPDRYFEFRFAGVRLLVMFEHFQNSVRDCSIKAGFNVVREDQPKEVDSDSVEAAFDEVRGICWRTPEEDGITTSDVADRWLSKMIEIRQSHKDW